MTRGEREIKCVYHGGTHTTVAEVKQCAAAHAFRVSDGWSSGAPYSPRIATIGDVEELVTQIAPPFGDLIDGIAVARGRDRWDLVEECASLALASATGEAPNRQVYDAARQIAVARLRDVSFDELGDVLTSMSIAGQVRDRTSSLSKSVESAVESMDEELHELALLLTDPSAPSLVAAAARLRKLDRPDLSVTAATRAIERDGTPGVSLTVRAAAHLDKRSVDRALSDIEAAEADSPSAYTANVWARLETGRRDLEAAEHWALLANERDPDGIAGAPAMMKIRTMQRRYSEAGEWATRANTGQRSKWSEEWMRLQAADELIRSGDRQDAIAVLSDLWNKHGYAPARRRLLEVQHQASD